MTRLLLAIALLLPLTACDSGAPDAKDIPTGNYTEFGVRQIQDGEVVSEGLAGVYFQRVFQFEADGTFAVEVFSDFAPEQGTAQGQYEIGDALRLQVESSTTSFYSVGSLVVYDEVEVVDGSYQTTFDIDGGSIEFRGPGLVLSAEREDADGSSGITITYFEGPAFEGPAAGL
jgi:hypothetical protein